MAITTWAKVQVVLGLAAAKQTLVNNLIPLIEADYLSIRNKPFDIGNLLTITAVATSSGNITITLDGIDYLIAVTSGDSAELIARKIKIGIGTLYYYDISAVSAVVTFKNKVEDTELILAFAAGNTGVTASISGMQLVYPDGAEMTAIDMINYRLGKKTPGVSNEKLGDYSISYTSEGSYPKEITSSIKRYMGWV